MGKLTCTQLMLRPILNFTVERFFPNGAFFGNDYLGTIKADKHLLQKWGSVEMACMMFVTDSLREQGATEATFTAESVTKHGAPAGSWEITVRKTGE